MLKIQSTRDYRLFSRDSGENRRLDIKRHKKLELSMKKHGFLPRFPIIVIRDKDGKLTIWDGQHRFAFAEALRLPIYYVEVADETELDIADIQDCVTPWKLTDYAERYADNGIEAYVEGLKFAKTHQLPIGITFALLSGTSSYGNIKDNFIAGKFKIKDRAWADAVAALYVALVALSPAVKRTAMVEACMAVSRVPEFDPQRLLAGAKRCREKLVCYSNKDAYIDMLEYLYNFGRGQSFGLKAAAANASHAVRERVQFKPKQTVNPERPAKPNNHKSAN